MSVTVTVDTRHRSTMPSVLKPSLFTFRQPMPGYALTKLTEELTPGVVEIDISKRVFEDAWSDANCALRAAELVPTIEAIEAAGGSVVLAIARIPQHLSSESASTTLIGGVIPEWAVVVPTSWAAWQSCVEDVIGAINNDLGHVPDIKIGWEPDNEQWQGTETEYFQFYRYTAEAVKTVSSTARVGGPGLSSLYTGKTSNIDMFESFLAYVVANAVPLDFVVWHQFNTDAGTSYEVAVAQVRAWLTAAGLSDELPLMVGEWSSWESVPSASSSEHDSTARAAHAICTMAAMARAGVSSQAMTSLIEQYTTGSTPFIGSFGVFTNQYIKKPIYSAFYLLSQLGDTRAELISSDQFVDGIAGYISDTRAKAVVAVCTPSAQMLDRSSDAYDLYAGSGAGATVIGPIITAASAARGTTREVTVLFKSMRWRSPEIRIYRIDSTRANPASFVSEFSAELTADINSEDSGLGAGLVARCLGLGYTEAEIIAFDAVNNSATPRADLFALEAGLRQKVVEIADIAYEYIAERYAIVGEKYNCRFGFRPVGEWITSNRTQTGVTFLAEEGGVYMIDVTCNARAARGSYAYR